jgi:hypothetical protein
MNMEALEEKCIALIEACRVAAADGTVMYTPDGMGNYKAFWARDFAYMAEYMPESVPDGDLEKALRFFLSHVREDGWAPDRVTADLRGVYSAGPEDAPIGLANLDNAAFTVFIANELFRRLEKTRASELFGEFEPALKKSLDILPYSEAGLIYNDPAAPHSPYGFTDCVGKTGELFMESLLCWRAFRMLAVLSERLGGANAAEYSARASAIEKAVGRLYDADSGMFFAAARDCRQIDVWANAYMLYIGFPCGKDKADSAAAWLAGHAAEYIYEGQIRHLPKGQYWSRLLCGLEKETYQNGAYWATATGWVAWSVARTNPALGAEILDACVQNCMDNGFYECVGEKYAKLDNYVASGANLYGCAKRILAERGDGKYV